MIRVRGQSKEQMLRKPRPDKSARDELRSKKRKLRRLGRSSSVGLAKDRLGFGNGNRTARLTGFQKTSTRVQSEEQILIMSKRNGSAGGKLRSKGEKLRRFGRNRSVGQEKEYLGFVNGNQTARLTGFQKIMNVRGKKEERTLGRLE